MTSPVLTRPRHISPQLSRLASERAHRHSAGGAVHQHYSRHLSRHRTHHLTTHHSPPPSALRNPPRRCRNTLGKASPCPPPRQPATNQAPPLPDPASRSSPSPTSSMSAPCTRSTAKPPPSPSRTSLPMAPKVAPPTLTMSSPARTRSTSTSSFAVVT